MKAKGRALFLHRMRTQSQRSGTVTLEWIRSWDLESQSNNPPCREKIPPALEYLRQYAMDAAYVPLQGSSESLQTYKRRMYDTLHTMLRAESGTQEMRITRLWSNTDWSTVWKNIGEAPVSGTNEAEWYEIIHEILPTNVRLHKIRMVSTDKCGNCDTAEMIEHRLIECAEGKRIWKWTRERLARMLGTDPERIPVEWLTCPHFNICPRKRHRAILWTLAKLVIFRIRQRLDLTLHDFIEFMRRTKWKMYQAQKRKEHVGDYLTFIDTESKYSGIWKGKKETKRQNNAISTV